MSTNRSNDRACVCFHVYRRPRVPCSNRFVYECRLEAKTSRVPDVDFTSGLSSSSLPVKEKAKLFRCVDV
jgi:hypothetical protein